MGALQWLALPKSNLDPYYERAQPICGLGRYQYDSQFWSRLSGYARLPFSPERVVTRVLQMRFPPVRFGTAYRESISNAENISVYLHANALEFEVNDAGRLVTQLRAACLQGPRFRVSSRFYILATGGIENARLLLLSNQAQQHGLGNQYDLVGKFFMEHPTMQTGLLLPMENAKVAADLYRHRAIGGAEIMGVLAFPESLLRREGLLNVSIEIHPVEPASKGLHSAKRLVQGLKQRKVPDNLSRHLVNVLSDLDDVIDEVYKRTFNTSKGLFNNPQLLGRAELRTQTEQAPNPDSRVTLSTERDLLGQNKVRLNWRLSAIDKRSVQRAHEIIAAEVGRVGLGRVRIDLDRHEDSWPPSLHGGGHHMGTTRMHEEPRQGVVDANSQVHGIGNLFIAGSSVFPTSGFANPTLTIVALAIRLADYIKRLMS